MMSPADAPGNAEPSLLEFVPPQLIESSLPDPKMAEVAV
jgi:hypothetical protein